MADNTTAAAGSSIATDDIGGVHYQRTKPVWGADGTATDVSTASPLPVNINALQLNTFKTVLRPANSALVANTLSLRAGLYHLGTATKTIKIRTIEVSALMSNVVEATICEIHWITAAPTGATAVTAGTRGATGSHASMDRGGANPEATAAHGGTWVSAGLLTQGFLCYGSAAAVHGGGAKIYDHQEGSAHTPLILRAGQLEGIAVGLLSNAAVTPTLTVEFTFTEE